MIHCNNEIPKSIEPYLNERVNDLIVVLKKKIRSNRDLVIFINNCSYEPIINKLIFLVKKEDLVAFIGINTNNYDSFYSIDEELISYLKEVMWGCDKTNWQIINFEKVGKLVRCQYNKIEIIKNQRKQDEKELETKILEIMQNNIHKISKLLK